MRFDVKSEHPGDYVICRPSGEIDAYSVGTFREKLSELVAEPRVVIDLSDVTFMDSAGLGALIGGIRKVKQNEGTISVACSRGSLSRLLHTTGFDRLVVVTDSLEEAIEALDVEYDPDA